MHKIEKYIIEGWPFRYVCEIVPDSDEKGELIEYKPPKNLSGLSFHAYGEGPFCKFKIPPDYNRKAGVYIIFLNGEEIKYVGECKDLGRRFNAGYGNISPRNCYEGGQRTNCRINNLILNNCKQCIQLLFLETKDRFKIEKLLIEKFKPEWNKQR